MMLLPLVVSFVAMGCGPSTTTVSGTVTYQNKLVKGGSVTFVALDKDKPAATGPIKEDGTYSIPRVPVGEVKVCVDTKAMDPSKVAKVPKYAPPPGAVAPEGLTGGGIDKEEMTRRFVRIPDRYADPSTTDLQTTISGLGAKYDIQLKP
jgi:hypothetical protein